MSLRIGLDFDGVFADCNELKDRVADDLYGTSYHVLEDGDRRAVRDAAYGDPEYALTMSPIKDAFQYTSQLAEDGHTLVIITSRDSDLLSYAQDWYAQQRTSLPYAVPDLPFIGVGYQTEKLDACRDEQVDVFVDDDLHKLEPLNGTVPHRFHFGEEQTDATIATPVATWTDLYQEIDRIR